MVVISCKMWEKIIISNISKKSEIFQIKLKYFIEIFQRQKKHVFLQH